MYIGFIAILTDGFGRLRLKALRDNFEEVLNGTFRQSDIFVGQTREIEIVNEEGVVSPARCPGQNCRVAIDCLVSTCVGVVEPVVAQVAQFRQDNRLLIVCQLGKSCCDFRRWYGVLWCGR